MASLPTPKGERRLKVTAFSSLQESHEDDTTKKFISALPGGKDSFVRVGKTVILNRKEVTTRMVDVLVFRHRHGPIYDDLGERSTCTHTGMPLGTPHDHRTVSHRLFCL